MKWNSIMAGACAAVVSFSGYAVAANIIVGSGPDVSYYVLESPNIGSRTYEIYYTYDAFAPLDGWALLQIVDSADSELEIHGVNYGSPEEPNYFINAITWQGVTETNAAWPTPAPYWAQWVSGGESGYPAPEPIAGGVWTYGEGFSAPYRLVEPGTWDGLVFGDGSAPPSVAPVPEPSAGLLALAGLAVALGRRSRR